MIYSLSDIIGRASPITRKSRDSIVSCFGGDQVVRGDRYFVNNAETQEEEDKSQAEERLI